METEAPLPAKKAKKAVPKKRDLKTAKRKDGVPILKKKKSNRKKWIGIGIGSLVALMIIAYLSPRIGTIQYGLCKTFVELNDPYPTMLEFVQAEQDGNLVIIDYNRLDSFGQRSLNSIRCSFKGGAIPPVLTKVDVNGKANKLPQEDQAVIDKFNLGIPALIKNKPNLALPKGLPDDIKKYR